MRLSFIGGGTMAEAIIHGVIDRKLASPSDVLVGEPVEARRTYLKDKYRVAVAPRNLDAAAFGDLVILAIKPQTINEVGAELRGTLKRSQSVLSILAGTRLANLGNALGHAALVRIMPNTPAQIGWGMSVWTATPEVSTEHKGATRAILKGLGEEIEVADEKYIDMATALNGSGPAYVFMFIEALIDAGVYLGLPRDMARALTLQTVLGSAQLTKQSGLHPAALKDMVTSPGGTTIEALSVLEDAGFRGALIQAVSAAYEKAQQLGDKK